MPASKAKPPNKSEGSIRAAHAFHFTPTQVVLIMMILVSIGSEVMASLTGTESGLVLLWGRFTEVPAVGFDVELERSGSSCLV